MHGHPLEKSSKEPISTSGCPKYRRAMDRYGQLQIRMRSGQNCDRKDEIFHSHIQLPSLLECILQFKKKCLLVRNCKILVATFQLSILKSSAQF